MCTVASFKEFSLSGCKYTDDISVCHQNYTYKKEKELFVTLFSA